MNKLTKGQIKEAGKKASKDFKLPEGWDGVTLSKRMEAVIRSDEEYTPTRFKLSEEAKRKLQKISKGDK